MKLGSIFLLLALSQTIYSAPVTDKSVKDRELDSWMADIEQALDEEMPVGGANIQENNIKEGPALDRNGEAANMEGPVDMEDWEEEIETQYGGENFNEEIESKGEANEVPSDDDLGYEPDTTNDQLVGDQEDNLLQTNSMGYPEDSQLQIADDMATDEEPAFFEQSQYKTEPEDSSYNSNDQLQEWEESNEEYKQTDDTVMEMQELENVEPSHIPEDHPWEDVQDDNWQELPESQQGYYMEMANDNKQQEKDEPWKEPSFKDFDDLQFDDKFKNDDMKEDPVNKQPVDYWKEQDLKEFDDLKYNGGLKNNGKKEDFVNSQSDDMEVPVNTGFDVEEQRSWESEYNNFDDLGVAEDMSINLDNAAVEESDDTEPWAVSNDVPDDFQPEIANVKTKG